jgi:hypothetical protein
MQVRSCRVSIKDIEGMTHTVEVTASSVYEAVAQGLATFRRDQCVAGLPGGLNTVKVSVANVRVDHEVKMRDFEKWLEKHGGSPREVMDRQRIRAILGMAVAR